MALTNTDKKALATAVNPNAAISFLGGSHHKTQTETGPSSGLGNITYDANNAGSYERAVNAALQNMTPDQLLQRYGDQNFSSSGAGDTAWKGIYDTATQMLGRPITSNEWAQILPAFQGPNGSMNGRAYLANLSQQQQNDPQNPNSPYNPNNPNNQLSKFNDPVTQQFQSILGRAPTSDEINHFSSLLATNQTDAYGLSSFLKQMPEYTNAQDQQFRSGLNTELAGYDQNTFDRMKGDVMGDYARRGMAPGSSPSLDYALTDLMGQLAKNRGSYMASLSTQQYGGNKNLAVSNYQGTLDQMQGNAAQKRQQQMGYGQQLLNQGFAGADYTTQMNDYLSYMNNNRGRSINPMYGAVGGAVGAGFGAAVGGPAGAGAGASVGSGLGNSFGYLNQ